MIFVSFGSFLPDFRASQKPTTKVRVDVAYHSVTVSVETMKHIYYQLSQVLLWPWRYYVTKTVKTRLDPPYRWKKVQESREQSDVDSNAIELDSIHTEP